MDPNAALAEFRAAMQEARDYGEQDNTEGEADALQRAVERAEALDEWITNGGYLPEPWRCRLH